IAERYNIHFDLQSKRRPEMERCPRSETRRRAVNTARVSSEDRPRGPAKVLRIHSVRPRDEDTDPRSHRPEGVGNWVRRVGGRLERPREFVWTHGGRDANRSGAAW